jgi:phosphoribosylglycinamide formyltransferase-1
MKKILIFASGNGSNFEAIAEFFKDDALKIELLHDIEHCTARERAVKLGIEAHFVPFQETCKFLMTTVQNPYDLYVLAGYMRILPPEALKFGTFINIHPSLLPKYKGLRPIERAYAAREKECGVTIHYVSEEVDSGEVIKQCATKILPHMSLDELKSEIHKIEHKIYPRVIKTLLELR